MVEILHFSNTLHAVIAYVNSVNEKRNYDINYHMNSL